MPITRTCLAGPASASGSESERPQPAIRRAATTASANKSEDLARPRGDERTLLESQERLVRCYRLLADFALDLIVQLDAGGGGERRREVEHVQTFDS